MAGVEAVGGVGWSEILVWDVYELHLTADRWLVELDVAWGGGALVAVAVGGSAAVRVDNSAVCEA